MAITFPLTAQTTGIAEISIEQKSVVGVSRSPFTGDVEVFAHQGQWWNFGVTLKLMNRAEAETWLAFLMSLNGREGTFLIGDVSSTAVLGSASVTPGAPVVKGAAQSGQDLLCDGGPNSATGYLKAGDWVQLGTGISSRIYKNLVDVNTDGSGNFTMTLFPKITTSNSPSDNQTIIIDDTVGVFRLNSNLQGWGSRPGNLYTVESFTCTSEV